MARSRYIRATAWMFVVAANAMLLIAIWALTSQSALEFGVARLLASTDGRIEIVGAKRTGVVSFDAERIRFVDDALEIDALKVRAVVSFVSVLRARPVIETFVIDELRVAPKSTDGKPPTLPASLASPADVDLKLFKVRRLSIVLLQGAPIVLQDIDLSVDYRAHAYAFILRSLSTPWGALQGRATLSDASPYAIDGGFGVVTSDPRIGRIEVALAGDLAAMGIGATAHVHGVRVVAQAAVLPFSPSTLVLLRARASAIDLRTVEASLPRTRIDADVSARLDRGGEIGGNVQLVNRAPGLPVDDRVPIVSMTSAFSGSGARWSLTELSIDAGRAGRLHGRANVSPAGIAADLQALGLDLSGVHAKLHATSLSGPLRIATAGERVTVEASLRQRGAEIGLSAAYAAGRVEVARAHWTSRAGRIEGQGAANVASPHVFELTGRLIGIDPSRIGDFPAARLTANFDARGQAVPLSAVVNAKIVDSRFRNQPLSGSARGRLEPERSRDLAVELRLGAAKANISGSFGTAADRLHWALDLPDASLLHADAAGTLKAQGTLHGTWRDPAGMFDIEATKLRFGTRLYAARGKGAGVLAEGWSGRMEISLDAEDIRWAEARIRSARFVVEGSRARHEARLEVAAADHRVDVRLTGSLDAMTAWRGTLQTVQVRGPVPIMLEQPVGLVLSTEAVRAGAMRLAMGQGRVDLNVLDWSATKGLITQGALSAVALGGFAPVLPVPEALRKLVVGGHWDIVMADTLTGRVSVNREGGDMLVPGSPTLPARLQALNLEAQARGPDVSFQARIESQTFGHLSASGSTRAERRGNHWGIAGAAPLQVKVEASMPSLAWTRPWTGEGVLVDGSGALLLQVSGTISEPSFAGSLQGRSLETRLPELGLSLRDGVLDATFDRQQLVIRSMRFASGQGQITGIGTATLVPQKLAARVELTADKLTVLDRPDRVAIVSGRVDLSWNNRELRAQGKLTADRGLVELPREDTPRPSSDVVVVGKNPVAPREANINADLTLDLGQNFLVRGRGISTRLGGTLRAQLAPRGGVVLTGAVRTVDGTYTAFGQRLEIQRGVMTFAGAVDNPALDIFAVRKMPSVEVGVAVGGSALLPQIRLVSTPAMSDAEKLAWLTLGHGLDQAGKNEAAVLQAAAMALLSRGNTDSKGSLASRFGLDELSLGTATGTGERVVTLGKRFATSFYLGFEQGITGAVSVIKITYDLSKRWSVQARAGSENAVDLFYTLGFR